MIKKNKIQRIMVITLFIILTIIFIGVGIYSTLNAMIDQNTYIQCCNGNMCSDTYYTPQDNLCHLTLCESTPDPFLNKSECTYKGANISVNLSNG